MNDKLLEVAKKMRAMLMPTSIIAQEWDRACGITPKVAVEKSPLDMFTEYMATIVEPSILELGTAQSIPGRSTMHRNFVPHAARFVGSDISAGPDVDLVADVHRLTKFTGERAYDAIITCSGFEHFKYPHLAAWEIAKTLRVGGAVFIQTHFTFVEHSYPYDYFRFTREAMAGLFGTGNGITVHRTSYEYPCRIQSPTGDGAGNSHLNVTLFGVKTSECPPVYAYDYDTNIKEPA